MNARRYAFRFRVTRVPILHGKGMGRRGRVDLPGGVRHGRGQEGERAGEKALYPSLRCRSIQRTGNKEKTYRAHSHIPNLILRRGSSI